LAEDAAAFTSNKNISHSVINLQRYISDLESWLYKRKIKINTNNSTAVILKRRVASAQKQTELFEEEIP
jgi:hypothetical protein